MRHREQAYIALDIPRLLQVADKLDLSVDWLCGRTGKRDISN
jgi:hypothetical protein